MSAPRFASALMFPLGMLLSATLFAQAAGPAGAAPRNLPPPLFLSEEWRQGTKADGTIETGEVPVMQHNIAARSVELDFIGPSANEIQVTGIPDNKANPLHVWTGLCTTPCGIAFRDRQNYVDLTGLASIKWNTKVSGMHAIHPAVKLADGTWLVGDQTSGSTVGWLQDEIAFASMKWLRLDEERAVTTGNWVEHPDLSRVDEVGFVDLIPGSGHGPGGWSDVAEVEVYGVAVPRE